MIIKGKDVIGLKVVTVDTGTVIQTVDDIAYDPTNHRITALLVDSGGLFSSAKAIHIDDVRNIGEDAVIVHDASAIQSTKELSSDVRSISDSNKHLVKTNVLTIDGKELGKVTDIFFDSETGYVDTMEVSQGGLKTMTEGKKSIKPSDIVTIGADATIVSTYTEAVLDAQGEEGGLKGMFNDAKAKTEEFTETAKESIQNAAEKTADVTKDAAENIKEKSVELKDATAERVEDLRDSTQQKAQELEVATREKTDELQRDAAALRSDTKEKVDEFRNTAARQTKQARSTIDEKAAEAQLKANELKDDIVDKSNDLAATARAKTNELQNATSQKREDIEANTADLSDEIIEKSKEMNATARSKAEQTKSKIASVASEAKEQAHYEKEAIKDTVRDQIDSAHHTGDTLVEKATQVYEDKDKIVKTKKTSVKKA